VKPIDSIRNLPDMMKATYDLVAQVPKGKVTTYGDVARALGDIVASRFVGVAMSLNQDIVRVPCRRVIQSDGSVGGYTGGGPEKKSRLLRQEGVPVSNGKIADLDRYLFNEFTTHRPLARLRSRQVKLKKLLNIKGFSGPISRVAGLDVAYQSNHAFAAMVVFDYDTGNEIEEHVVEGDAVFPYIPTYLAYREMPVIEPLMKLVEEGTVLMYDGNGILHPEGFGIASQLGAVFEIPTVGIAKKLLCGDVSKKHVDSAEVRVRGKLAGHSLSTGPSAKPVFVSAGHMVSPRQARDIASRFLKHRIPEPTRRAHIVAESARRGTINK